MPGVADWAGMLLPKAPIQKVAACCTVGALLQQLAPAPIREERDRCQACVSNWCRSGLVQRQAACCQSLRPLHDGLCPACVSLRKRWWPSSRQLCVFLWPPWGSMHALSCLSVPSHGAVSAFHLLVWCALPGRIASHMDAPPLAGLQLSGVQ